VDTNVKGTARLLVTRALVALTGAAAWSVAAGGQATPPRADASRFEIVEKSIPELQEAMRSGAVTSRQLVELYLERIRAYDQAGPRINSFIAVNPRAADAAAALDEERRTRGARGPLHGIPIAIKDNYVTSDMPTTGGAKALESFRPERDAFMVKRLRDAGAVIVGKTNLHELAYGLTTASSMGGQTRNPYDPTRNPGGSSGGTGAALAANFAAAGLGTDTCGSIRVPSANNNLFGLRPTMGLSSRSGIIPLALTQDVGGPLARTVTDLAILLDASVGFDPDDPITIASQGHIPASYVGLLGDGRLTGVRIGILTSLFGKAAEDQEVAAIVRRAVAAMTPLGAEVTEVEIPELDRLLQGVPLNVINSEFKFNLNDFLASHPSAPVRTLGEIVASGRHDPSVDLLFKRAEAVTSRDSEPYRSALQMREAAIRAVMATMSERGLIALAYPTLTRKPASIGQPQPGLNCQLSAATGLPAIAIPAGFTDDRLPVGMDLIGAAFSEPALLKIAYAYERAVKPRRPPASVPPLPRGR
jgi:Asp-tRNA(Asn)/Glu-tRNA(Gln) amidotransferase A subunit family amidase